MVYSKRIKTKIDKTIRRLDLQKEVDFSFCSAEKFRRQIMSKLSQAKAMRTITLWAEVEINSTTRTLLEILFRIKCTQTSCI